MIVNFATEDGTTVSVAAELPAPPPEGTEVETGEPPVVYTVERVRFNISTGEAWCLLEEGEGGNGGGRKKPKKPHPWKK